ncbi:hypothetical protein LZZ85_21875 [Terrimonas sp. NA20]|uniref:Uncharacterized protein n=1 Tax=Terrimonas ginsenosidimutans TaxID=2908004 RepID=A0ABS9KXB7_9BACT|nr:hypothetical protein [Terrimonas ginsenosidimutans]MCG2616961.1 hypothetical protein [Terrimonas ginsenosidimutans]
MSKRSSNRLPKLFFPIFSLVIGSIYGAIMLNMSKPFEAITSFFVSITLSGLTLWIEFKAADIAAENQITGILSTMAFAKKRNLVWNLKIEQLLTEIEELDTQAIRLNESELEEYTCKLLKDIAKDSWGNKSYCATHIVNTDTYLNVWGKDCPYYKSMVDFVQPQKEILNKGGSVVRIFIFTEDYLTKHLTECEDMLAHHDSWFKGTKNKVTTLFLVAESLHLISNDITIVNNEYVFEWQRNLTADFGYAGGKCYIKSDMKRYVDLFDKLKRGAHPAKMLRGYMS